MYMLSFPAKPFQVGLFNPMSHVRRQIGEVGSSGSGGLREDVITGWLSSQVPRFPKILSGLYLCRVLLSQLLASTKG